MLIAKTSHKHLNYWQYIYNVTLIRKMLDKYSLMFFTILINVCLEVDQKFFPTSTFKTSASK